MSMNIIISDDSIKTVVVVSLICSLFAILKNGKLKVNNKNEEGLSLNFQATQKKYVANSKDGSVRVGLVFDKTSSYEEISAHVKMDSCGAFLMFEGTTRNHFEGKIVSNLYYECYPEMAVKELMKICVQCKANWNKHVEKIYVEHLIGNCPVGATSIVIAISSQHRAGTYCTIHTNKRKRT